MAKSVIGLLFVAALALAAPTPTQNIVQLAAGIPDLSTLVTALKAGNLVTALSGAGPFTVFAPTNEAFAALPQATLKSLLEPKNIQQLQSILEYHVISGAAVRAEDLKASQDVKTLEGQEVHINKISGSVTVQNAKVIQADVGATNGVVHVINGVLTPPTATATAVDNAGLPKPQPIIDTDKYETVADSREVSMYTRHTRIPCSYPNFHFNCANLDNKIKVEVQTLKCNACQGAWPWYINYCAKDGSSYAVVYYTDQACQNAWIIDQPYDGNPYFHDIKGNETNRNCFTGTTQDDHGTSGCYKGMDITNVGQVDLCTSGGQCPPSQEPLKCEHEPSDYCCDLSCNTTTCADECCNILSGKNTFVAAYEYWFELRSSSPYTPSPNSPPSYVCDEKNGQCVGVPAGRGQPQEDCESSCFKSYVCDEKNGQCVVSGGGQPQKKCESSCTTSNYMCKDNKCVKATSGGASYDDCSKVCQGVFSKPDSIVLNSVG